MLESITAIKLFAYRTRTGGVMWLWNPVVIFLLGPLSGILLFDLSVWLAVGLAALMSCWFARISVDQRRPGSVRLTRWFLFIPFQRRDGLVATVMTGQSDMFDTGPDDEIQVEGWSLACHRPELVADWIRNASTGFQLPKASVVDSASDD